MTDPKSTRKALVKALAYCLEILTQCVAGIDAGGAIGDAMKAGGGEIWEHLSFDTVRILRDAWGYSVPDGVLPD